MKLFFFRKRHKHQSELFSFIESSLGISPKDMVLYEQAFRHKSVIRHAPNQESNERLEFLGDSVISTIVADFLYEKYPEQDEGFLTRLRAKIVSRNNLNLLGEKLNLEPYIDYLKGPSQYKSLSGNVLEALFGAIYLDQGYEKTKSALIFILEKHMDIEKINAQTTDFKSELLIHCQKNKKELNYQQLEETIEDNALVFTIGVYIDNVLFASAKAGSKRKAEHLAAKAALEKLD